jgi:HEAT repeat protein
MYTRLSIPIVIATLGLGLLPFPLAAEERTMTPEQMEKLAEGGDFEAEAPERPTNLPDLTKGDPVPAGAKSRPPTWTLGPTGIVATFVGLYQGDQLQVQKILKGSPSEGKLQWGDVLVGMNGVKFQAGGNLAMQIGNAIIDAEKEENEGRISFMVWRDKNFVVRNGKKDLAAVDIEQVFDKARDDNSLYDWKSEEEREKEVVQMGFDEFPIDPETFQVELKLRTFPSYSDTAPYNCPKTAKILDDAYKVLENKFIVDPKVKESGRGGIIEAIALIASGKPEHRELVRQWVRGPHSPWKEPTEPIGAMFEPGYKGYKGYQSWHKGFAGLYCAIYYEATGDDFVLPALRKYAIETAMGQSALGSWGHTFAYPSFNGGKLHQMNPGYGALNAAGNRCFFLVTLAQKLGIDHPEIDLAVERGRRFFSSYIDQGCIPYGDHPAYGSDDSNGKNSGVAFSLKLLGDDYGAKYFAMMSSHCAFTRRGGHGHDYHGNWSSWAAGLCGPEVRAYNERNLRWHRTLSRMFDGSFVYHGGYGPLRDPTATEVFHQAVIHKQTLITGKDPNEALYPTKREMKQLLASARGQFQDPWLKELAGTPWPERSTDEIFDLLDIFYPKARDSYAKELGKRFQAGEKDIVDRLLKLLDSDNARFRDGALRALGACGSDTVLASLSKLTPLLKDSEDFVRITAARVISGVSDSEETQLAMLEATNEEPKAIAPNSVRNTTQAALFAKDNVLANNPFEAGFDEENVRKALEHLILLDPARDTFMGSRLKPWTKDTILRVAGPLTEAAENEQLGDQMFADRSRPAQALLGKFQYREGLEATADRLRRQASIRRDIRPFVGFKRPLLDPDIVKEQPAAFREFIDEMTVVLTDDPNTEYTRKVKKVKIVTRLDVLHKLVMAAGNPVTLPSVSADVRAMFGERLAAADGSDAKLKLCREELADPARKTYFRKMAAIDFLTEMLGVDALAELVPYLNHDYWRLRDHARATAAGLVKAGGGDALAKLFAAADPNAAAGILAVFAVGDSAAGLKIAATALGHESPVVRAEAAKTLAAIQGTDSIPAILARLGEARDKDEIIACEEALLTFRDDSKGAPLIRDSILKSLADADPTVRPSLYFILARLGDDTSMDALEKAAGTNSFYEFREIVHALSYSLSRKADQVMLRIADRHGECAKIVGEQSVRRLVLGPAGFGDITNAERMDFAEPMLKRNMDGKLIKFLGHVHDARALRALMYCLEKGVRGAAESLVTNAEGIDRKSLSPGDNEIAVKALQGVMEYMEVTHLRGGPEAHMKKEDSYTEWKALQARAGKAMLKLHQPEKAPIPTFDPLLFER